MYFAVLIHEAAHFAACKIVGGKVKELRLTVYGANLRTEYVLNPIHSMIISAAGPFVSGFTAMAFAGGILKWGAAFKAANTVIFFLNIFPALPLDGGNFLNSLLAYRIGYIKAHFKMLEITRVVSIIFAFFGIIFLILSKYNISLLVISGILLYNLKEERKKLIFLKEMIYTKEFDRSAAGVRIKHTAVTENVKALHLTDGFGYNFICHFFVYDAHMTLLGTLAQGEIVDGIIEHGADVTVGRLIGRNK